MLANEDLDLIEALGKDIGRLLCPFLRGASHGDGMRTRAGANVLTTCMMLLFAFIVSSQGNSVR
jgi:hypothetical protein